LLPNLTARCSLSKYSFAPDGDGDGDADRDADADAASCSDASDGHDVLDAPSSAPEGVCAGSVSAAGGVSAAAGVFAARIVLFSEITIDAFIIVHPLIPRGSSAVALRSFRFALSWRGVKSSSRLASLSRPR
jgi:hypothetical protein